MHHRTRLDAAVLRALGSAIREKLGAQVNIGRCVAEGRLIDIWASKTHRSMSMLTAFEISGLPGRKVLAILTEQADNPGESITNGAERFWPHVAECLGCKFHELVAIEHYGSEVSYASRRAVNPSRRDGDGECEHDFSLVELATGRPGWRFIAAL